MLSEEPGTAQSTPPRSDRAARERRPGQTGQAASIGL
jgi:hypothetical protein